MTNNSFVEGVFAILLEYMDREVADTMADTQTTFLEYIVMMLQLD